MKAVAVVPSRKEIRIIDAPSPTLSAPDDVIVRVLEVGICGTDKEIARFDYGDPPAGCEYLVIGHECLGEVMEAGPQAKGFSEGDLVVPTVRRPCGDPSCTACANFRQDFCYTGNYKERGIKELHGFMTQQFAECQRYLHKVSSSLRHIAVLVEPLTIAQKALRQIFDIQSRLPWSCSIDTSANASRPFTISCRRALVLGAGPVGLLGAMTLVNAGFETIVYSNIGSVTARKEIVEAIGGRFVASEDFSPADLHSQVGKIDVVYEAVGASQLAFDVLGLLDANAIFVFTGVPGRKAPSQVDTSTLMRNMVLQNQALVGTVNAAAEDFESAITSLEEFNSRWPGLLQKMKTGEYPPEEAPELLKSSIKGIKNVVRFA